MDSRYCQWWTDTGLPWMVLKKKLVTKRTRRDQESARRENYQVNRLCAIELLEQHIQLKT